MNRCRGSSGRCRRCRYRLDRDRATWELDAEGEGVEEVPVLAFEVVLVVANVETIPIPSDIYIPQLVLFSLACFSE